VHSFDMLGEAAKTHADADRYARAYGDALDTIAAKSPRADSVKAPGISVKLSALHPRYEWSHAKEAQAAILPVLRDLAMKRRRPTSISPSTPRKPTGSNCRWT
jgi:RHH-type proline utilization regulon transcriptional repressor/proline dehydrogenase/delta 1-pyrroline-5-carboxylate dehydrogenase